MDRRLRPCTALLEAAMEMDLEAAAMVDLEAAAMVNSEVEVMVDLEAAMEMEIRRHPMSPSRETRIRIQSPHEHHSEAATPK